MHTEYTEHTLNLRIHIAPIGFEIDRIVMPATSRRADKVWLLEDVNEKKALSLIKKVKKQLKDRGIEVATAKHDRGDLFNIIKSIRDIINDESGNNVYVNLASGSKIQAIGGMLACMMFNESKNVYPMYVEAANYRVPVNEPISEGVKEISDIPSYEIQIPDEKHIRALDIIIREGSRITKKRMAELAQDNDIISVQSKDNISQARFASLDKNIIQPLQEKWKFIEVQKIGRTRWIQVTDEGKNAAKFLL